MMTWLSKSVSQWLGLCLCLGLAMTGCPQDDAESSLGGDAADVGGDGTIEVGFDVQGDGGSDGPGDFGGEVLGDFGSDVLFDEGFDEGLDGVDGGDLGCPGAAHCPSEESLCSNSGGTWFEEGCGHTVCGEAPVCPESPVPSCDCGPDAAFEAGVGCVGHECSPEAQLCEETSGTWNPDACEAGHCGAPAICLDGAGPGACGCPVGHAWDEGDGCVVDSDCEDLEEEWCETSGGSWATNTCGHTHCGDLGPCDEISPGCTCGPDEAFFPGTGCALAAECDGPNACLSSGGTWTEEGCPNPGCDIVHDCAEFVAHCECGPGMALNEEGGCSFSDACEYTPEEVCMLSGGTWDEAACGSPQCGIPNDCDAETGGCDCGGWAVFDANVGCIDSRDCGACPDPRDPRVGYVGDSYLDPEICQLIDFDCLEGYDAFSNECGCGCIFLE